MDPESNFGGPSLQHLVDAFCGQLRASPVAEPERSCLRVRVLASLAEISVEGLRSFDAQRHGSSSWPRSVGSLALYEDKPFSDLDILDGEVGELGQSQAAIDEQVDDRRVSAVDKRLARARAEYRAYFIRGKDRCRRVIRGRCSDSLGWVPLDLILRDRPLKEVAQASEPTSCRPARSCLSYVNQPLTYVLALHLGRTNTAVPIVEPGRKAL